MELKEYTFYAVTKPCNHVKIETVVNIEGSVMATSEGEAQTLAAAEVIDMFKKKRCIEKLLINKKDSI